MKKSRLLRILLAVLVVLAAIALPALAADGESENGMYATFWALVPPIVAIVLALITKEA